jgi:LysR family transcriptional regulator for bpeEF and oprC
MTDRDRVHSELLSGISIFVQVGQSDSLTAAARKLNISASGVSRAVSRLEARLGVRLVNRTTRSISLTAEGETYFEQCKNFLNDLLNAEDRIRDSRSVPRGRLRVRLPRAFGRSIIIPTLTKFGARYPEIILDVRLVSGVTDMVEHGIDVAMQLGRPKDARLVARSLGPIKYVLCASPSYLQRNGTPSTLSDLAMHRCLSYIQPFNDSYRDWTLTENGRAVSFQPEGTLNIDDVLALVDAAVEGAGIAYVMDFTVANALAAGQLKIVMPDFAYQGPDSYIVYPPNRYHSSRVKAFVDFLLSISQKAGQH